MLPSFPNPSKIFSSLLSSVSPVCAHRSLTQPCLSLISSSSISEIKSYTQPLLPVNKMIRIFLFAIIGAIGVFCQSLHSYGEFSYQGCSSIDPSCFGNALVFSDGRLTPESCQRACQGHLFAALLPDSCRCGDDPNGVQPADESKCDYPCMGDNTLGMCGSICPETSPVIANVYTRITPSQAPAYGDPTNVQSSVAAADTSCASTGVSSVGEPWQPQRITPVGPAPGVPTSLVGPASGDPAATAIPTLGTPANQSPQESPCTTESNTGLYMPSQGPLTPTDNAPEPKTFSSPNQQAPNATPSPNCVSPQPESYSGENTPGSPGGSPGGVDPANNCDPAGGPDLSPVVSPESTLWPWPSKKPEGDPPVPSHVPASDSPSAYIPPLSGRGFILLAVAVIM
ncbi:hypothetical protein ACQKWADRAFT_297036 [Trichoderma austrokoningii]